MRSSEQIDLTPTHLGTFDFSCATALPLEQRFELCLQRVLGDHAQCGYAELCDLPPIPPIGASEPELEALERQLDIELPLEYRAFLCRWRYLDMGTGLQIWGLDYQGVGTGEGPWISHRHPGGRYLVFGYYWQFADGDQLMFKLDHPGIPVVVYLHECRPPAVEWFAPSFSLALWRIVHEALGRQEDLE